MKVEPVQPFWRRIGTPVAILLAIWLLANAALLVLAGRPGLVGNPAIYRLLNNFLFTLQFVILLFGTLFIYPVIFFRGTSLLERIGGSIVVPLIRIIWAMLRATAYFPAGQAVYYGFNSVGVGSLFLQLAWIGIAETGCRWVYRRRTGDLVPIFRWPYMLGVVVGFLALYLTLFWDGGVHWFYLYQEGYKLLFQ